MTLLLNYRPVLRQPTGIGVYANAVLPALRQLPHVLVPGGDEGSARERLKRLAWSQFQLPRLARKKRARLIFTPAPEGYLGPQRIPQVVMVHDLRTISHPERSLQSAYFRAWVPPLLRSSARILTNSIFTAHEIERCTGVPMDKIRVIPLGYDDQRFQPDDSSSVDGHHPYLLHIGQAYPHKNLHRLIKAFAALAHRYPEIRLVLAGKPHPSETPQLQALVRQLGLDAQIEWRPYVAAPELAGLYRGALAFLFPSLWEGFGLPVLEAMACGTPVLTSYGSGTQEVAADAALLVDPLSALSIREGLLQLLEQPLLRLDLRQRGLQRARSFGWSKTAEATRTELEACLNLL